MSAVESNFDGVVSTLVPLVSMSPQQQAQVVDHSEVLNFERGAFVFKEGDSDPYAFYLLDGEIELISGGQTIQRLIGGSEAATNAMAQLQPRKMSARAESAVAVLRVERSVLDELRALGDTEGGAAFQVAEIDSDEDDDWMTRMLQSKLFSNLPASNIHRIFSRLETVEMGESDIVVRQNDPGDFYYVLVKGRAEITRAAGPNAPGFRLAMIGPGDAFGEEALVGGGPRNATVRMLTAGELVRLTADDFSELIKKPLLSALNLDEARDLQAARGATWLDVRFPEQHEVRAIPGSINHPLNTLRMHSGRLDDSATYIIYCDDGTRSSIAAFLLAERGFDVRFLQGGLDAYSETRGGEAAAEAAVDAGSSPAEIADPATAAAVLNAELELSEQRVADTAKRERELEAAKVAAEARKTAEAETAQKLVEERKKAAAEADKKRQLDAAEVARRDQAIAAARDAAAKEAELQLAREREKTQAELANARAEAEQLSQQQLAAERQKTQAELANARAEAERLSQQQLAAEREKTQAELANARAEAERLSQQQLAAEREKNNAELEQVRQRAKLEAEQRLEAERRAEALLESREAAAAEAQRLLEEERKASQAEFNQTLRKAEMEAQMRFEAERQEAEKKIAEERAKVAAELAQLRKQAAEQAEQLLQAEREKASIEVERARQQAAEDVEEKLRQERQKLEQDAEAKLQQERQKLEHDAELARREAEEAKQRKEELEKARAEAEEQAERERAEQAQRVEQVRAEMERRLKEEESKLRESYAWQAEELKRLQEQKRDAERRLQEEQQRVVEQSEKARNQLNQAREYQNRLEQVEQASAAEAHMREQQEIELKRRLREELNQKVQSERVKLEQELARNAAELQRARREREAAEAAGVAAREEAENVVAEFKKAHARKRMQEEAEMRVERERLETEAKRMRLAFELAQRERDAALENQRRIDAEISARSDSASDQLVINDDDLRSLELQADSAAEKVRLAEKAQADMQAAAVASAGDLAAHRVHEEHARADLKRELDDWLNEQSDLENSDTQRAVLANQKAHMERIKKRAQEARLKAKDHDQSLIDELAAHLQGGDLE